MRTIVLLLAAVCLLACADATEVKVQSQARATTMMPELCVDFPTCDTCTSAKWTDMGTYGNCAWCAETKSCNHTAQSAGCRNWVVTHEFCRLREDVSKCSMASSCHSCLTKKFDSEDFDNCVWCIAENRCVQSDAPCRNNKVLDNNWNLCPNVEKTGCAVGDSIDNCQECVRASATKDNEGCAWCETSRKCEARFESSCEHGAWTTSTAFCMAA